MSTENNVVSLEHSVVLHVEKAILGALRNHAGKWVGQHMLFLAAEEVTFPNLNITQVINEMVKSRLLERSFQTVYDKLNRPFTLPLYRLAPSLGKSHYNDH